MVGAGVLRIRILHFISVVGSVFFFSKNTDKSVLVGGSGHVIAAVHVYVLYFIVVAITSVPDMVGQCVQYVHSHNYYYISSFSSIFQPSPPSFELQPADVDKMLKPIPAFEGLRLEGDNIHRGQGNYKVSR